VIITFPFVFFLLAIELSALPRITSSDYPFVIFKLFLYNLSRHLQLTIAPCVPWTVTHLLFEW
jgi:hypothetical protein